MNWGSLGDISFRTTYTPGELQSTRRWRYTPHQFVVGYPAHDFHGEDEHRLNFKIELHAEFIDPWQAYQALRAQADSGQAHTLMIGSRYLGEFAIRSMQQTLGQTDLAGNLVHLSLQIEAMEVRARG